MAGNEHRNVRAIRRRVPDLDGREFLGGKRCQVGLSPVLECVCIAWVGVFFRERVLLDEAGIVETAEGDKEEISIPLGAD